MLQICKVYAERRMHIGRLHDSVAYFRVFLYRGYISLPGAFFQRDYRALLEGRWATCTWTTGLDLGR